MTHAEMCKLAVGWLKRPQSRGGHGCKVAIDECRTGFGGEIPDAIGFSYIGSTGVGGTDGTVLVEVKVSRSDFLADKAKPHRVEGGVGNWRYFMTPQGLIAPEELPPKWGLIEVTPRGHIKTRVGVYSDTNTSFRKERAALMRHDSDTAREFYLLVRMFDRFDHLENPENLIALGKERNRLGFRVNDLLNDVRELKREKSLMEQELIRYRAEHGVLPALQPLRMQPDTTPRPQAA